MTKLIKMSVAEMEGLIKRDQVLKDSNNIRNIIFEVPARLKNVKKIHIGVIFTTTNAIPIKEQLYQLSKNCHLIYIDKDACDCDEALSPGIDRLKMEEMGQIARKILKSGKRVSFITYMLTEEEFTG